MFDKIAPAGPPRADIRQECPDKAELVVPREDQALLCAPLLVFLLDHLGVVLEDVSPALAREDLPPEVVGLEAAGVRGVPCAVVPPLVEGEKPRGLALKVRAHPDLLVVHGEMHEAASELEEQLPGVAVPLVLLDGVVEGLLGQAVLQLESGHRQAVDKQAEVQGELALVPAVLELARRAEDVGPVEDLGFGVAGRGGPEEERHAVRAVLDAAAQDLDDPALRDLTLESVEEGLAPWAVIPETERFEGRGLGDFQKLQELCQVDCMLPVVVLGIALEVARFFPGRRVLCRPG